MSRSSAKRRQELPSSDEVEYLKIAKMSDRELLDYVLASPYLLTDSYYRGFDTAIYARAEQLAQEGQGCSTSG